MIGRIGKSLFAIANGRQLGSIGAKINEKIFYGVGATVTKGDVVFVGAALITVAFHGDCPGRPGAG